MNSKEMKEQLISLGVTEEQVANIDFEKISNIIDNAASIEEAASALKNSFAGFDEESFKKIVAEQSDAPSGEDAVEELSDQALSEVAGGSIGSWMKKNKNWLIPVASLVVVGVTAAVIGKVVQSRHVAARQKLLHTKLGGTTTTTPQAEEIPTQGTDVSFGLDQSFASI